MSAWPQFLVIIWLVSSVAASLWFAARPARGWLVLTAKQQRLASLGFAFGALSEASLLLAGGFFKGIF